MFRNSTFRHPSLSEELFLLMSVLSQTFFTFVSGHLMTFSLFSAWHNFDFLLLFYLFHVLFYRLHEHFCRFERRYVVSRYYNGGVLRYVSTCFFCSFLNYETSETSQIDVLCFFFCQGIFQNTHKSLNSFLNCHLFYACSLCNFCNDFCFCYLFLTLFTHFN